MKLALTLPGGKYNLDPKLNASVELPSSGMDTLENIISWGTTVLIIGAVILSLFFLIWGGIQWITSRGNKESLAAAQKRIIFSVIGLAIAISAFMIINILGKLFGVDFFS